MSVGELVLFHLRDALERELGARLLGLYVYGSFAAGGYADDRSDLDVLAVLDRTPDETDLERLWAVHEELVELYPDRRGRVETAYVSAEAVRRLPTGPVWLARISPGEDLHLRRSSPHWLLDWYGLQEDGVVLHGPPVRTFLPHITHEQFTACARDTLLQWRDALPAMHTPGGRAFAVLTVCRLLAAATTGERLPKAAAGLWARERFPRWEGIVQGAQRRQGRRDDAWLVQGDPLDDAPAFLEFAIEQVDGGRDRRGTEN